MKTLDEVIAELEDEKVFADALHYLKEYQRYQNTPSRIGHMAMCDENEPLTWDELKGMEGKPVWVEDVIHEKGEWILIHMVEGNDIWYVDKWADKERLNRDGFDRLWQAYEKER